MKLGKLAQIAEIISGVAVLITLIFLYIEVRENSAVIRASSYGQSTALINEWRYQGANSPELTRLFRLFANGEANTFNEIERQQFGFYLGGLWGVYESSFFAREYGILGEQEWGRFQGNACNIYQTALPQELWLTMKNLMSEEFSMYIESECAPGT